jgi:hypothetical protein
MAKFEVELDDATGKPVGTLPDALQKFYDEKFKQGERHGAEIAEVKAKKEYEAQILALRRSTDPLAEEKIKGLEDTLSKMREAEALREKRFDDAIKERDKRAQVEREAVEKERDAAKAESDRRAAKLHARAAAEIRAEAIRCGALDKSLDQIAMLLGNAIGLDDQLEFYVKDEKDGSKPRLVKAKGADGKETDVPVTIAMLVEDFMSQNTHFVKAGGGSRSGTGRIGASLTQHRTGTETAIDQAVAHAEANPTDRTAVSQLVNAITRKADARVHGTH